MLFASEEKHSTSFFNGYRGDQTNNFTVDGQIGAAGLCYLMRSLGYHIDLCTNEGNSFTISVSDVENNSLDITKITNAPVCENREVEYIYDIETKSHHFAAGVGNMIVHNSMYGALGAQEGGKLPLPEAAACVTAKSRESIQKVNATLLSAGKKIVYGDSVTHDTPILCRLADGSMRYYYISDLPVKNEWITYRETKEIAEPIGGLEVWSDQGFTPIKYIIRHVTNKNIMRITTNAGCVSVTEDHSLLTHEGKEISPSQLKVGDQLMHKHLPAFNSTNNSNKEKTEVEIKVDDNGIYYSDTTLNTAYAAWIHNRLGYDVQITDINEGKYTYRIDWFKSLPICAYKWGGVHRPYGEAVVKIENLGKTDKPVYDLSTANHHFSAGIGSIVVHNTDSTMPDLGITNGAEAYSQAKHWAIELSKLFPPPMEIEDEEVFDTLFCICKKKYAAIRMTRDGTPIMDPNKMKTRGIILARRDNCAWQKRVFRQVLWNVMTRKPMMETLNMIYDECLRLLTGQVPWEELVMIKGLGANYKSATYCMKVFSDQLANIGKPANAGDRLSYLIVKSFGVEGQQNLGYKMRLPETYLERLDSETPEKIDYNYYIEKVLKNCVEQVFRTGYQEELGVLYEKYAHIDQLKVLNELRLKGYGVAVDQLMDKCNGDKKQVIDMFLKTDIEKIVKRLVSVNIVKRGQLVSRVTKEPIKLMLKMIEAKKKFTNYIKTLVHKDSVPIKSPRLNITPPQSPVPSPRLRISTPVKNWQESTMQKLNMTKLNITKLKLNITPKKQ